MQVCSPRTVQGQLRSLSSQAPGNTRKAPSHNQESVFVSNKEKPKSTGVNTESNENCESCVLSNCLSYSHISVDGPDEAGNPPPRQALVPAVPFHLKQEHFPRSATDVARER